MQLTFSFQEVRAAADLVTAVQRTTADNPLATLDLLVMTLYHRSLSILTGILPLMVAVVETAKRQGSAHLDIATVQLALEVIAAVNRVEDGLQRPVPAEAL